MGSMSMKHNLPEMMDLYVIYLSMPCLSCLHHFIISCSCTALRSQGRTSASDSGVTPLGWIHPQMTWWWLYISKWGLFHLTQYFGCISPLFYPEIVMLVEKNVPFIHHVYFGYPFVQFPGGEPWCRPQTLGSLSSKNDVLEPLALVDVQHGRDGGVKGAEWW